MCPQLNRRCSAPLQELLCFDLGAVAGAAAWAPFSATVLAAATDAGRVMVFDLEQNAAAPLCSQKVRTMC